MFHLAIPSRDIQESIEFYKMLGFTIGRTSDQFAIINFCGHQVVCHKVDEVEQDPKMYPRHFGIICENMHSFYAHYGVSKAENNPFFQDLFIRYKDKPEEHRTFFLKDPSNNLLEFKWYKNEEMVFGK